MVDMSRLWAIVGVSDDFAVLRIVLIVGSAAAESASGPSSGTLELRCCPARWDRRGRRGRRAQTQEQHANGNGFHVA